MDNNKLLAKDSAIHEWYRFVLSYPPHLVRHYLEKFGITENDVVLDPFCGTGTTNIECLKNGIPSVGIEANPMTWLASSTKSSLCIDANEMYNEAERIAKKAISTISSQKELRKLSPEQEKLILKNSISDKPLSDSLILRDSIISTHSKYGNYYLLALAKHIVGSYSNLKFGPEVGISRKKVIDVDVVGIWLNQISAMRDDILLFHNKGNVYTKIFNGDSRNITSMDMPQVTAVITSPPYPNEKDYSRATRLESVVIGLINSKEDLRRVKKEFLRSNTKNIYMGDTDDLAIRQFESIMKISNEIESRRIELKKTSGFEKLYSRVVLMYFGGMYKHFAEIRRVLKPGAKLAYVVGDQASYFQIPIRTSAILGEIATSLGFRVEGIDTFRTRFATGSGNYLNEDVLVLSYKGD